MPLLLTSHLILVFIWVQHDYFISLFMYKIYINLTGESACFIYYAKSDYRNYFFIYIDFSKRGRAEQYQLSQLIKNMFLLLVFQIKMGTKPHVADVNWRKHA